jgi:uncharacterized membrane protein
VSLICDVALAAGLNPVEVADMPLEFFLGLQTSLLKRSEQEKSNNG